MSSMLASGLARKPSRSYARLASSLSGFTIDKRTPIPEFDLELVQLSHQASGAKLAHVYAKDANKTFAAVFRTPPTNDTGVPHILEHTVLCGSEAFPVRDPFFKMLKRSMSTFMNAMTAQDYTMYPFSTVSQKDFENLLDVYLDAAFFPLLRRADFEQEGHRLELSKPAAGGAEELVRSGVVYNEMKGALSDSSSAFSTHLSRDLFGPTVFGHVSGGDPRAIPDLTYDELVQFHRRHYHPRNALFVSYGDMPLERTCELLSSKVLDRPSSLARAAEPTPAPTQVRPQPCGGSRTMALPPDDAGDDKVKVARAWLLPGRWDAYDALKGKVLSSLLLSGPQAPVYAALIDAQVAPEFSPGSGFDAGSLPATFSIGAQGIPLDRVDACEAAILKGLEAACEEGFAPERVEAVLHQLELSISHKRANFGLSLAFAAAQAWAHGGEESVPGALQARAHIDRLRAEGLGPGGPAFWRGLCKTWARDGWLAFDARLVGVPSSGFQADAEAAEERALDGVRQAVDKDAVRAQNAELKRQRELPEDLSVLPTLRVSDIPLRAPEETQVRRASARTELVEDAANGVGYVRLKFEPAAAAAGAPLLLLLPVLANLAGAVDAAGADYKRVALLQELYGGSLQVVPRVAPDFATGRTPTVMYVEHDLLAKNAAPALELLGDVLAAPSFGSNEARRLQGLLATHAAACTASLTQDAMAYSRLAARASLGPQFAREELFGGTPRVAVASKLASGGLAGAQQLAPVLDRLSRQVFSGPAQASVVARPGSDKDALLLRVEALLDRLERAGREGTHREAVELPQALDAALRECVVAPSPATYIQLSVPVHYTTAVVATPARYGHADDAALTLLGKLAQHDFLHREVREKGGAYGAGASLDAQGLFSMTSYWDPNSRQTLETYSTCVDWLCQGSFDASKVDEALLSVFGDVDAPQSPSGKGLSAFLHGVTNEMRQERRARFLDLAGKRGVQRLAEAAQKHLASAAAPGAFLFNGGPVPGLSVAVVGAPGPQGDGLTAEAWTVRRM